MGKPRRQFDPVSFRGGAIGGAGACTVLMVERLHRGDHVGAVLCAVLGYVILPVWAYVRARRRARRPPPWYSRWVAKHIVRRGRDRAE